MVQMHNEEHESSTDLCICPRGQTGYARKCVLYSQKENVSR